MAERPHLEFRRIQRPPAPRRKSRRGPFPVRYEDRAGHAAEIEEEADEAVEAFATRREEIDEFDPKLILRIDLGVRIAEDEFERAGLRVLDSSSRHVAVVFADDAELTDFRRRLAKYQEGPRERAGQDEPGSAAHEGFFDAIDSLRPVTAEDRVSRRLSEQLEDEPESIIFDVECWFVDQRARLEEWLEEIEERVEESGGDWIDAYISSSAGVAQARCRGSAQTVRAVADLDQVAVVDTVPQPRLDRSDLAALQDVDPISVSDPPDGAPVVGVVDSGLLTGHPLLEPAVAEAVAVHPEFGNQAEDGHGHGTLVSGIALYGNVLELAERGDFEPHFSIASVRVLDDQALVPENVSFVRVISDAVRYLAETWECPVVNLSIGDSDSPYVGGKSTPLASALDSLARAYDIVIVVSAGNVYLDDVDNALNADRHAYPEYLLAEEQAILDPSQAATALTVGAICSSDGVAAPSAGDGTDLSCIAPTHGPSPFTRHGPGVQNAIKPELSADGGNLVFDLTLHASRPDVGSAVISTSGKYPDRLFEADTGTSYAAPFVTHLAGRLAGEYPELGANTIRALLLQGAVGQGGRDAAFANEDGAELEEKVLQTCGYGELSWERCGMSDDNRMVLYAEDRLRGDDFHVYRIPVTEAFSEVSGPHELTVALGFDPPVRHRRYDYLACRFEFQVVRGVDLEAVYEMASSEGGDPDSALSDHELPMRPPRTVRSRGANQLGRYTTQQRPQERFADDWYLVVRNMDRWLDAEAGPQNYSVAVCIEVERAENLYVELEQEIQLELETEVTV